MSKSNGWSRVIHHATTPSGSLKLWSQVKLAWSVTTMKWQPVRLYLKNSMAVTTERQLLIGSTITPLTHIKCFGGVRDNAFDYLPAFHLLLLQDSTHAHVTDIRRQVKLPIPGRISQQGGSTRAFLKAKKACSRSSPQTNLASFLVKPVRGAATATKLGM